MAPFSASRYVKAIASRKVDRQLFSLPLAPCPPCPLPLGLGPLIGRAGDAAVAREGN